MNLFKMGGGVCVCVCVCVLTTTTTKTTCDALQTAQRGRGIKADFEIIQ